MEGIDLNAMEQDQSGEKISLSLEDWELARAALSCRMVLDMLIHSKESLLSPWTGCDSKGEGCGERMKQEGT